MRPKLQCGHTQLHAGCAQCLALKNEWYAKLEANGFEDAENAHGKFKAWTGVSIWMKAKNNHDQEETTDSTINLIDSIIVQEPNEPVTTTFMEGSLSNQERLLHHPDFDALCKHICSHGNHLLDAKCVASIWTHYVDGDSNRNIGAMLGINDSLVWRTIRTLTQWMALMDLDEEQEQPLSTVILRDFNPVFDQALIYATWRNALWYDDDSREEGNSDRFFRNATKDIKKILDNPATVVRIACLKENPSLIIGYSVITGLCLHFVYVKADYRKKRIGSLLVPRAVEQCSPVLTKIGRAIAVKRGFVKKNRENEDEQEESGQKDS